MRSVCAAPSCDRKPRSTGGYCETHYYRLRRRSKAGLAPLNTACAQCGGPIKRGHRFCSENCRTRHHRGTPEIRSCVMCAAEFKTNRGRLVCSSQCATERARSMDHERRVKLEAGAERFSRIEIFERDRWTCRLCSKETRRDVHPRHDLAPSLDHIIPIARGGAHTRSNTQCVHLRCNFIKQARIMEML
jgi:hypothetical protein